MSAGRRIRVVLVDDEPLARARLERILGAEDDVDIVGAFGDGDSALRAIPSLAPDLLLLDVQMPGLDGRALATTLASGVPPLVVFVTAHADYAVDAFALHALDYLLKPVDPRRLQEALRRVRQAMAGGQEPALATTRAAVYVQRIAVPDGHCLRLLAVSDVDCVIAQGNYVNLHVGSRTLLLRDSIGRLAQVLDPTRFLRIHRSRIVRLDQVEQVEPYGAGQYLVRLRNGMRMTSGRLYRDSVRDALGLGRSPATTPSTRGRSVGRSDG